AERYYATQSSNQFLSRIRIPALLIAAQDDPLIPFAMYRDARPEANPLIQTNYPAHGGHLGFLARHAPRFWADETIIAWIAEQLHSV
ncbi:MAG: hydrolase, partial [Acidobacteriota bacterium]|nr:hydrolase [Acidobacteriota bacterium]